MHLWFKGVEIFCQKESAARELQECWPLTFGQNLASFLRLPFEYEIRSLIIVKILRYFTDKNAPCSKNAYLSRSDLDFQNIDPFLYGGIPIMIMYQYQYVVQPDRLNNGIIGTSLRKGLCLSMTDCDGTTTGIERKSRQLYMKSFKKWWIQYLGNMNWRQLLKNLLQQEI